MSTILQSYKKKKSRLDLKLCKVYIANVIINSSNRN